MSTIAPVATPPPLILLAEDEPIVAEAIAEVLRGDGYEVEAVSDGEAAWQRLQTGRPPDLVLTDITMPGRTGRELLQSIRGRSAFDELPVIFLTAHADLADIRAGLALGADDYITKPFDPRDACQSIKVRLDRARKLRNRRGQLGHFMMRYLPHELRTPLAAIIGFADLMKMNAADGLGLTPEENADFAAGLMTSAERLERVMKNFTLWLDLESRRQSLGTDPRSIPLYPRWLESLKSALVARAQRNGRSSDLKLRIEPAALPVPDSCLSAICEQLLDNACKFSPPGSPIEVFGRREGGGYRLMVCDQGRGMTPAQIASIGLFQQFDRERLEQQGLGLGLELCRLYAVVVGCKFELEPNAGLPGLRAGFVFHAAN